MVNPLRIPPKKAPVVHVSLTQIRPVSSETTESVAAYWELLVTVVPVQEKVPVSPAGEVAAEVELLVCAVTSVKTTVPVPVFL